MLQDNQFDLAGTVSVQSAPPVQGPTFGQTAPTVSNIIPSMPNPATNPNPNPAVTTAITVPDQNLGGTVPDIIEGAPVTTPAPVNPAAPAIDPNDNTFKSMAKVFQNEGYYPADLNLDTIADAHTFFDTTKAALDARLAAMKEEVLSNYGNIAAQLNYIDQGGPISAVQQVNPILELVNSDFKGTDEDTFALKQTVVRADLAIKGLDPELIEATIETLVAKNDLENKFLTSHKALTDYANDVLANAKQQEDARINSIRQAEEQEVNLYNTKLNDVLSKGIIANQRISPEILGEVRKASTERTNTITYNDNGVMRTTKITPLGAFITELLKDPEMQLRAYINAQYNNSGILKPINGTQDLLNKINQGAIVNNNGNNSTISNSSKPPLGKFMGQLN